EFRVAMVQGLLVGQEPGVRAYRLTTGGVNSPVVVTPDEFLRFYREQRTELTVRLLQIRVKDYLARARQGKPPTEDELERRVNKGRDLEPSPSSPEPGFKEPRKIAVEYVVARMDDPYYRDLARKQAKVYQELSDPKTRARWLVGGVYGRRASAPLAGCP